jgi:hypothetical protein
MLRRISIAAASAALLGLSTVPAFASPAASHANSGSFNVPSASSVIKGWGSYKRINSHVVHVQMCAKRTSGSSWVGAEAIAYNSNYSKHTNIAAVLGPDTPGASKGVCAQINLLYTGHLKVFTFVGGNNGKIAKKSAVKTIY